MASDLEQAQALQRAGQTRDALLRCRELLAREPERVDAWLLAGSLSFKLHELADAAEAFRRALQLAPEAAPLHRNLGTVLRAQGQLEAALSCFQRAAELRRDWSKPLQGLATTAMELGRWQAAVTACHTWLSLDRANVEALGLLSIALDELGESNAADVLLDFERLFRQITLSAPPPGFASVSAFNAALTRQVLEHPTLRAVPPGDPRYHCPTLRQTEEFCAEPTGPSAALRNLVASAIDGYITKLQRALPDHPFVAGAARRFTLKSWATVLDGEGNLEPHVHYGSYVSAVYYPKIPSQMAAERHGDGGLEFGGGPARFPCRVKRPARTIEPHEGLLVLFPSYFYHRTAPFQAAEPRIAIAFDSVALG